MLQDLSDLLPRLFDKVPLCDIRHDGADCSRDLSEDRFQLLLIPDDGDYRKVQGAGVIQIQQGTKKKAPHKPCRTGDDNGAALQLLQVLPGKEGLIRGSGSQTV